MKQGVFHTFQTSSLYWLFLPLGWTVVPASECLFVKGAIVLKVINVCIHVDFTIFVPGRELLMKVTFVEVSTTEIPSIASAASQGETGFVKIIPDMSFLWGALISVKPKFKAHASSHERAPVRSAFMVYFSK
mmetsp:Transcript_1550/g.3431  ORF Transcript_1550/g.3431 Transcript_1550/m.3431 type:complete len:132 (-) Transcript_1550:198-593(-)